MRQVSVAITSSWLTTQRFEGFCGEYAACADLLRTSLKGIVMRHKNTLVSAAYLHKSWQHKKEHKSKKSAQDKHKSTAIAVGLT